MLEGPSVPAVVEDHVVAVSTGMYTAEPEFGFEDISRPRLRLGQGLTPEVQDGEARPGDWLLTGYDPSPTVELVPIGFMRVRTLRGEEREVLCSGHEVRNAEGRVERVKDANGNPTNSFYM